MTKDILASHKNPRIRHHSEFRTLFWKWKIPASLKEGIFIDFDVKLQGSDVLSPLSGNYQVGVFRPFLQRSLVQFRKQLVFLSVIHVWTSNLFTFSLCPCDSKMIEYELLNLISSRISIQLNFTKIVKLWFLNKNVLLVSSFEQKYYQRKFFKYFF